MKGSFLWKLMFLFCALAGCLAGYGYFHLINEGEWAEYITKDNTLVRDSENSVFFAAEKLLTDVGNEIERRMSDLVKEQQYSEQKEENRKQKGQEREEITKKTEEAVQTEDHGTEEETALGVLSQELLQKGLDAVAGSSPAEDIQKVVPVQEDILKEAEKKQEEAEQAFTYPAEIFGQVPVINHSDAYVTYFEFAHDLIERMEPEIKRRGLNEMTLFTQFALKALFCGVTIQNLDINAPISRKEAALTLWLAAEVMGENGSGTSVRSAEKYAVDVKNCSGSEKKAIAYLYEQGILSGYQIGNQKFYPDDYLTTETGENWLLRAEQCWK
ncbi:MAG: S-layer homology domain-containing protein [Lachnospiraceae bacterium]|nr:S-layer homology domain-containing protein [Lachnospiraceae bacterium]